MSGNTGANPPRGFLVAGDFDGNADVLQLLLPNGKTEWEKAGLPARLITAATDGGYWTVGKDSALTRYDSAGKPLWHKAPLTIPNPIIACARASVDGLVLTGSFKKTYPVANITKWKTFSVRAPFIAKIGEDGELAWEESLTADSNSVYTAYSSGISHQCDSLTVSKDGVVTVAFSAAKIPGASIRDQTLTLPADPFSGARELDNLILQRTDGNNKRIRTTVSPEGDEPHLFADRGHYFLVERVQPTPSDTQNPARMLVDFANFKKHSGIRFTEFDADLRVLHSEMANTSDYNIHLSSVFRMPSGHFLVAGCSLAIPVNSLDFYSADGVKLAFTHWRAGRGGDECAATKFASGPTPDTAVVYLRSEAHGEHLETFKVDVDQP